MTAASTATSSEVQKRFGYFYDEAMTHPIAIERNGAARVVMMPANEYRRLAMLDHVGFKAEDSSDEDFKAIRDSRYPEGFEHLDELMGEA